MDEARATGRYLIIQFSAMLIFISASVGIDYLSKQPSVSQALIIILCILPIAALMTTFWAFWRYLTEIDEYQRLVHIKGLLTGTVVIMIIATGWGYLEAYADFRTFKLFWLNPIFWTAYAAGVAYNIKRDGGRLSD